jgi:hypothetical protein
MASTDNRAPCDGTTQIGAPATNLKLIGSFNSVNYYGLGPKRGGVGRR